VTEALKLGKHITPRAMRRTWHLTESMQEHYSTVALDEQREAMGKVIRMTRFEMVIEWEVVIELVIERLK